MIRVLICGFLVFSSCAAFSQLPEDVLKFSWTNPSGTARQQAIGGTGTALGGDLSSLFINPAGIGLYKTNEFLVTPGFGFLSSKSDFRGGLESSNASGKLKLGTSGLVFGQSSSGRWTSKAFAIGINRVADFTSTQFYKGQNDYSSFAEPLANEFAGSRLSIDAALNSNAISLLTKMALYTYLVDTATINGSTQVIARSEQTSLLNQQNRITSSGGVSEISLGYAANIDDLFYVGLALGIPLVNYRRELAWKEEDALGKGNNEFSYSTYHETYTSKGAGLNAKLGIIFKPAPQLRLGLSIHTPTLFGLRDNIYASMTTDLDTATGSQKVFSVNTDTLYSNQNPGFEYDLTTPWRILFGGAWVLHEDADVTRQRGFITAEVEYVTHRGSKFSPAQQDLPRNAYSEINQTIRSYYRNALNIRVGGELKFKVFMVRAGMAYLGTPYKDLELKANRLNLSGGLGYRNKGFFADLAYVHSLQKDVNFPYRVDEPRFNTFARLREQAGQIVMTFGVKF